eukprot:4685030-Amphidinium_carterae.2
MSNKLLTIGRKFLVLFAKRGCMLGLCSAGATCTDGIRPLLGMVLGVQAQALPSCLSEGAPIQNFHSCISLRLLTELYSKLATAASHTEQNEKSWMTWKKVISKSSFHWMGKEDER